MSTQTTLVPTFAGELISPGDPGYEQARRIFNGANDKRPALIARCTGPEDVQAALAYARVQDLLVAVRGGGTQYPGTPAATTGS